MKTLKNLLIGLLMLFVLISCGTQKSPSGTANNEPVVTPVVVDPNIDPAPQEETDIILPEIKNISIQDHSFLKGIVTISFEATDETELTLVELKEGENLLQSYTLAPFTYEWDTRLLIDGNYILVISAFDSSNNRNDSQIHLTIDNTLPNLTILSQFGEERLSGTIYLEGNAEDNLGFSHVEFYADKTLQESSFNQNFQFTLDTTTLENGRQKVTIKAYDLAGNMTTKNIFLQIEN